MLSKRSKTYPTMPSQRYILAHSEPLPVTTANIIKKPSKNTEHF